MVRSALAACVAALVLAPPGLAWSWPSDGPVLRPFAFGDDPYAGGQHRGIDVGGDVGAVVRAPAAGTVTFVGSLPGGGRAITIRTLDGYAATLLQLGEARVAEATSVAEGQPVGTIGASEDAVTSAPHVHLGIRPATDPRRLPRSADAVAPARGGRSTVSSARAGLRLRLSSRRRRRRPRRLRLPRRSRSRPRGIRRR